MITDGFVLHDYFVFWWCCSEVLITYLVRSQEVFLGGDQSSIRESHLRRESDRSELKAMRDTPNPSAPLKPFVYKGLRAVRCYTQTLQVSLFLPMGTTLISSRPMAINNYRRFYLTMPTL